MMRAFQSYLRKQPPLSKAYLDGWLYVSLAFFQGATAAMGSDEAAKWVSAELLFWIRTFTGLVSASLLALKMFLSTSYGDAKAKEATQAVSEPTADSPRTPV